MSEALAVKRGAWFNLGNDFHVSHSSIEIRSLQNVNLLFFRLNTETVEADSLELFEGISRESLFVIFALCPHRSFQILKLSLVWNIALANHEWIRWKCAVSKTEFGIPDINSCSPGGLHCCDTWGLHYPSCFFFIFNQLALSEIQLVMGNQELKRWSNW